MITKKRQYVVSIFAAVHTAEDEEMEHPSPILVKIPVSARSVEEATEKVGKALGRIAQAQQSDLERQEASERVKRQPFALQRNPHHPYNRPNPPPRPNRRPGPQPSQPNLPWERHKDVWGKTSTDQDLESLREKFVKYLKDSGK